MSGIKYYRDPNLPIFEIKRCYAGIHSSRKHTHEEFSVGVVLQGSSVVTGRGQDFRVGQGSVIIIPPEIIHRCKPDDLNHWQFEMLYLKPSWVESLLDTKPKDLYISVKLLNSEDYQRFLQLFALLRDERPALEKETYLITELHYFFDIESYFQQKSNPLIHNPKAIKLVREYLDG